MKKKTFFYILLGLFAFMIYPKAYADSNIFIIDSAKKKYYGCNTI